MDAAWGQAAAWRAGILGRSLAHGLTGHRHFLCFAAPPCGKYPHQMRFRSNNCVAIHIRSLAKAERFFGDVLGFRLKKKTKGRLEFDSGLLRLYINRSKETQPPTLSFSVKNAAKAKRLLTAAGCKVVADWGGAFYFRDPFGVVHDVIED